MRTGCLALMVMLSSGCLGPGVGPLGVDESDQPIVGGVLDTADPAVVLIFAQVPGAQSGSLCSGTVISPHLVLTAAHCVHPAEVGATAKFTVFTGNNFDLAQPNQLLGVKATHYNPAWQAALLDAGHDIGVVALANATTITPKPYNKSAMAQAMVNQPVRFVGFGITSGGANDAGIKRQVTGALKTYNNVLLQFDNSVKGTCSGDSGGPAFMNIAGVETLVGVTSFGDQNCAISGFDTRIDVENTFINTYVQMYDPATAPTPPPPAPNPSPNPSPSPNPDPSPTPGGTSPTTPGSTSLLDLGQACSADPQCHSGVCGIGNKGVLVCVANNSAAGSKTIGGCSFGGLPVTEAPGIALVLVIGVGMLLRRGLRRRDESVVQSARC